MNTSSLGRIKNLMTITNDGHGTGGEGGVEGGLGGNCGRKTGEGIRGEGNWSKGRNIGIG